MTGRPFDCVGLMQAMVRLDSTNPPGGEHAVCNVPAPLLESAGFAVTSHEFAPGRPTLLATIGDQSPGVPLVFALVHLAGRNSSAR